MDIERSERTLTLGFDSGVTVGVDLGSVGLTDEQLTILDKLASRSRELDSTECKDGHCPAEEVLEPEEFEKVRGLYVGLREIPIDAKGPIIDFCLHVHMVHKLQ